MTVPPGWSTDPFGRYAQRYWDGQSWTAHVVAANGTQLVDPMGITVAVPFAMPATAVGAAASTPPKAGAPSLISKLSLFGSGGPNGFVNSFGEETVERAAPTAPSAFGALGGVFLAACVVGLCLGDKANRGVGVAVGLGLICIAIVGRFKLAKSAHDLRAATVSLLAVGIVVFFAAAITSAAWFTFLAGVTALLAWLLPPFRGQPFLLGAGTYGVVFGIGTAIGNASKPDFIDSTSGNLLPTIPLIQGATRNTGIFFFAVTLLIAFLVYRIDLAGHRAISTPLLFTAIASSLTGVVYLGFAVGGSFGYFLATMIGIVLVVVAAKGNHRATLWFGAAMTAVAFAAFVFFIVKPSGNSTIGIMLLVIGAVIATGPRAIEAFTKSRASKPQAS